MELWGGMKRDAGFEDDIRNRVGCCDVRPSGWGSQG